MNSMTEVVQIRQRSEMLQLNSILMNKTHVAEETLLALKQNCMMQSPYSTKDIIVKKKESRD